jgi:2,4-dienoyl-CoA reductase-like NADH-dependent reductase (Old Yellow Enzyme family)
MPDLFSSITINGLTLPNRVVMAPMTRYMAPCGVPGADKVDYYRRRAEGGTGLIITEGVWVPHPAASYRADIPCFYGNDALAGWTDVIDAVHAAGSYMFPQLWHVGMFRRDKSAAHYPDIDPVGPSGLSFADGQPEPIQIRPPMTQSEIDAVVASFGDAARSAKQLGFDGIEIHGAHGYLIDQFFWHVTNRRQDRYGGADIGDRTAFAVELIAECRRQVGPAFPISFRFSQWKIVDYAARLVDNPEALERMLVPLVDAGVDLFHCSTRQHGEPAFVGSDLTLAGWTRKLSGKPSIAVGSVGLAKAFDVPSRAKRGSIPNVSLNRILEMLDNGECDLVAVGRALIANPDWTEKVRTGNTESLAAYSSDQLEALF